MSDPTCVSLFSGIGGLDLGLARAGFRHLAFCESDAYRRDVLRARWPGAPVYEDVAGLCTSDDGSWPAGIGTRRRALGGDGRGASVDGSLGGAAPLDLLCGGFPCQDLSVAGKRAGLDGSRSGLFHEFARIAGALRPRWLLVENVPGLLSSNGGRDFGVVLGTLADLGYGLAWRVLDSRFFGVPQRRRRVFVVGALSVGDPRAAAERASEVLAVGTRCPGHPATRGEAREELAVASLSGLGTGGPDDNDGQGGRLVAENAARRAWLANQESSRRCGFPGCVYVEGMTGMCPTCFGVFCFSHLRHHGCDDQIAAPLSHGSNPNSNAAGRRREDDENLVTAFDWQAGDGGSDQSFRGKSRSYIVRKGEYALMSTTKVDAIQHGASVRRLTPTECERLQALPDGRTCSCGGNDEYRQTLRVVWLADRGETARIREDRSAIRDFEAAVLRYVLLHGLEAGAAAKDRRCWEEARTAGIEATNLLSLRNYYWSGRPAPHRPESPERLARELAAVVRELSHEAPLGTGFARRAREAAEDLAARPSDWPHCLGGGVRILCSCADSKRYAALGDAVTASVSFWLGQRLIAAMRSEA